MSRKRTQKASQQSKVRTFDVTLIVLALIGIGIGVYRYATTLNELTLITNEIESLDTKIVEEKNRQIEIKIEWEDRRDRHLRNYPKQQLEPVREKDLIK